MVTSHDLAHELRERVNAHLEWLLVRESGRTFPLRRDEIDIWSEDDKVRLATLDYSGLGHWRVRALRPADLELTLELTPPFGTAVETVRLVPRTPARELSGNIELARLQRANLIGQAIIIRAIGAVLFWRARARG